MVIWYLCMRLVTAQSVSHVDAAPEKLSMGQSFQRWVIDTGFHFGYQETDRQWTGPLADALSESVSELSLPAAALKLWERKLRWEQWRQRKVCCFFSVLFLEDYPCTLPRDCLHRCFMLLSGNKKMPAEGVCGKYLKV